MSDHDRRGEPPHDEPLAFDRRERPAARGPAPLTLILSILLLLALAAAVFAFYRGGLSQGARAPKVIGTPVGDLRAAPQGGGGGEADPSAGLKIYQQAEGEPPPSQPNFTPPPEQPLPRPTAPAQAVAPPAAAPAAPPVTAPAAPPVAPPVASPPPAPVTVLPKPAPTPAPQPVPKPPEKKAEATPPPPKPGSGGPASVQIGAFSSEAIAAKEWSAAVARAGGAGRGKRVEKVERDGAVLYRTTVTGFPDKASAQAFCDRLKAAGKSCFVR